MQQGRLLRWKITTEVVKSTWLPKNKRYYFLYTYSHMIYLSFLFGCQERKLRECLTFCLFYEFNQHESYTAALFIKIFLLHNLSRERHKFYENFICISFFFFVQLSYYFFKKISYNFGLSIGAHIKNQSRPFNHWTRMFL